MQGSFRQYRVRGELYRFRFLHFNFRFRCGVGTMRKSGAYRHIEEDVGSSESKEVYRTGIMASLQERDRQRERKLATTRKKRTMKMSGWVLDQLYQIFYL